MLTNNKWQQEHNKKNKKLYDSTRNLIAKRKNEQGKTKTDLIRDFIDYKGDKWKYLIDNPLTRIALSLSSKVQWNTITTKTTPFQSGTFTLVPYTFNDGIMNSNSVSVTFSAGYFIQTVNTVKFPLEFGILTSGSGGNLTNLWNIGFSSRSQYGGVTVPTTAGINNNPFTNYGGDTGFSLNVTSGTWNAMNYYSVGIGNTGAIGQQSANVIPGLTPNFLAGATYVYFRFYPNGDKIGWSTNGTSWTYYTVPIGYNTLNLYLTLSVLQTNSATTITPNSVIYTIFSAPPALSNLP